MRRLNRGVWQAVVAATGVVAFAIPRVAWAPPICHGVVYHLEQLQLRVREATIDGVAVTLPTAQFVVASACQSDSVSGTVADLDPVVPDGKQQRTWVRKP